MKRKLLRPSIILILIAIALLYKGISSGATEMVIVGGFVSVLAIFRTLIIRSAANYDLEDQEEIVYEDSLTKYLKRDELRHVEMIEVYKKGAKVLYEERDGVLLFDDQSKYYYGSASSAEGAQDIMALLPPDYDVFIAHSELFLTMFEPRMRIRGSFVSYNYVYEKREPIVLPTLDVNATVKMLDESYTAEVLEHYSYKKLRNEEYVKNRLAAGMMGIFVEAKLVGFIGRDQSGSIGMLEIYEEYRNHHLGAYLQASFVNKMLEENEKGYIYTQIDSKNEAMMHIQESLGFQRAEHPNIWYFS